MAQHAQNQVQIEHQREPCPDRIIDDIGGAFGMGAVGGGAWHLIKGLRNSPPGFRAQGALEVRPRTRMHEATTHMLVLDRVGEGLGDDSDGLAAIAGAILCLRLAQHPPWVVMTMRPFVTRTPLWVQALRRESPKIGGSFANWGLSFSLFDCSLQYLRKKVGRSAACMGVQRGLGGGPLAGGLSVPCTAHAWPSCPPPCVRAGGPLERHRRGRADWRLPAAALRLPVGRQVGRVWRRAAGACRIACKHRMRIGMCVSRPPTRVSGR